MHDDTAIVEYVRLRAEYDATLRRLESMAATISAMAEALNDLLDQMPRPETPWPKLDDLAEAQADLRRLRGEMDLKWRAIPHPLRAALQGPPTSSARRRDAA